MEASAEPAGDLLPPPTERPVLFSGGDDSRFIIKEKKRTFFCILFPYDAAQLVVSGGS